MSKKHKEHVRSLKQGQKSLKQTKDEMFALKKSNYFAKKVEN